MSSPTGGPSAAAASIKAIWNAGQDETYRSRHQQIGQLPSFCPATRDPLFQDLDEPENNAHNQSDVYN